MSQCELEPSGEALDSISILGEGRRRNKTFLGELHPGTQKLPRPAGGPGMIREMSWGQYWGKARWASPSNTTAPSPYQHRPAPTSRPARWRLTQVVGAAQVEGVAAVNVVIQSLLNQVLRFVPCQLRHSAESNPTGWARVAGLPPPRTATSELCPSSILRAPSVTSSTKWVDEGLSATELGRPPARGDSGPDHPPGVQEDELHVQAGAEHEHVAVQFDLRDGAGRQRVAHGHQAHVLVAAIERGHVQAVLADLQVAAAVNDLRRTGKAGGSATGRKHPKKVEKGLKHLQSFLGHKRLCPTAGALKCPQLWGSHVSQGTDGPAPVDSFKNWWKCRGLSPPNSNTFRSPSGALHVRCH